MALSIPTSFAIRTYEGKDEWGSKKYLAHMNLGNDIYMTFFGANVKEAEERARNWYATEKARCNRIDTSEPEAKSEASDGGWGDNNDWSKPVDGRGKHFIGKVWMVKHGPEKHKVRIDQSQVAEYEAQGYVRGGPRS